MANASMGFSSAPSVLPDEDGETRSIRWTITAVTAAMVVAAIAYAIYRSWLGPVAVVDTIGTLRDGSTHTWKLAPGTYEIAVVGNGALTVALPGSNCVASIGKTYSHTCELHLAATLALYNPPAHEAVTYSIKAQRLKR